MSDSLLPPPATMYDFGYLSVFVNAKYTIIYKKNGLIAANNGLFCIYRPQKHTKTPRTRWARRFQMELLQGLGEERW
jgi:hypothetical protein